MNRYDFEQNGGIENWNGKLKKKNCNKPKIFQIFSLKRKNAERKLEKKNFNKPRKIFEFLIISELSNGTEILKRKIATNRERFFTFQLFGIEQQNGEIQKDKFSGFDK